MQKLSQSEVYSTSKIWSRGPRQSLMDLAAEEVSGVGCQVSGKKNKKLKPETLKFSAQTAARCLRGVVAVMATK